MHGRGLEDDEPYPALRAGLVVGGEVLGREAVVDKRRLVGRRDDPVRKLDRSYAQRAEKRFEQIASLLTGRAVIVLTGMRGLDLAAEFSRASRRACITALGPQE